MSASTKARKVGIAGVFRHSSNPRSRRDAKSVSSPCEKQADAAPQPDLLQDRLRRRDRSAGRIVRDVLVGGLGVLDGDIAPAPQMRTDFHNIRAALGRDIKIV